MIYVMSDIHGNENRYNAIMSQINLQPSDHLYVIGDVIDRGPDGISILQKLMELPNCTVLLGNHEYMLLNWFSEDCDGHLFRVWLSNGGRSTADAFSKLSTSEREAIISFVKNMPITTEVRVNDKVFLLAHGSSPTLYRSKYKEYANEAEFVIWDRLKEKDKLPKDKTLVFGHTPTCYYQDGFPMRIWYGKNRIGIDCGSGDIKGRLACLRLDDMKEFYSE